MDDEALRERYRERGWGILAEMAGYDPLDTESSARRAFQWCYANLAIPLADLTDAALQERGCFPLDQTNPTEVERHRAYNAAYDALGGPPATRKIKPNGR